jgi:hypothetical protein
MYKESLRQQASNLRNSKGDSDSSRSQSPKLINNLRRGSLNTSKTLDRKRLSQRYNGVPSIYQESKKKKGHALLTSPFAGLSENTKLLRLNQDEVEKVHV